jgi:hypothetical protein
MGSPNFAEDTCDPDRKVARVKMIGLRSSSCRSKVAAYPEALAQLITNSLRFDNPGDRNRASAVVNCVRSRAIGAAPH